MRGLYLMCLVVLIGLTQAIQAGRFDRHMKDIKAAFQKHTRPESGGYTPLLCGVALLSCLIYLGTAIAQDRHLTALAAYLMLWYWVLNVYVESLILLLLGAGMSVVTFKVVRAFD